MHAMTSTITSLVLLVLVRIVIELFLEYLYSVSITLFSRTPEYFYVLAVGTFFWSPYLISYMRINSIELSLLVYPLFFVY